MLVSDEVVLGDFNTLAVHQAHEVVFEQIAVDRLDVVEVVVTVGKQRCVDTVNEVVVGREREWSQAACQQLD